VSCRELQCVAVNCGELPHCDYTKDSGYTNGQHESVIRHQGSVLQ